MASRRKGISLVIGWLLVACLAHADLLINKSIDRSFACIGDTLTYIIVYENQSEDVYADIVWVIDGSGSMGVYQDAVSINAGAFLGMLPTVDVKLGVVHMGTVNSACDSHPLSTSGVTQLSCNGNGDWTADQGTFGYMVTQVGAPPGGNFESGLYSLQDTLQHYTFRAEAYKIFILLTDEGDQILKTAGECDNPAYAHTVDTINMMTADEVMVYAIVDSGMDGTCDTGHYWDSWGVAQQTGGDWAQITTVAADWDAILSGIGDDINEKIGLSNVLVSDTLPGEITYRSSDPGYGEAGPPMVWDIGNLAVDNSATITMFLEVTDFGDYVVNNDAYISCAEVPPAWDEAPPVYLITRTATSTWSPTSTATPTWSPTSTWTPTSTVTPTATPTQTPFYSFQLEIVNEAGEVVKIFSGISAGQLPEGMKLEEDEVVFDIGGGVFRELHFGQWTISWDGMLDDEGNMIPNGAYQVVVRCVDYEGEWMEEIGTLVVMKVAGDFKVTVRDDRGRLVKSIPGSYGAGSLGAIRAEPCLIKPGSGSSEKAYIKSGGCALSMAAAGGGGLYWDGRNEDGQIVQNGVYRVIVEKQDIGGGREVQVAEVTVVRGAGGAIENAVVWPNPKLVKNGDTTVRLNYEVMLAGAVVRAKFFTIAGELVMSIENRDSKIEYMEIDVKDLAGGMYIVFIEASAAGHADVFRRVLRMVIVK